jgi:hypothetical protein
MYTTYKPPPSPRPRSLRSRVLWCLARLTRPRASGVITRPDTRLTILSTRAPQCMRGVEIPPFQRLVSLYTDTHLYAFSLALAYLL